MFPLFKQTLFWTINTDFLDFLASEHLICVAESINQPAPPNPEGRAANGGEPHQPHTKGSLWLAHSEQGQFVAVIPRNPHNVELLFLLHFPLV